MSPRFIGNCVCHRMIGKSNTSLAGNHPDYLAIAMT